MSRAWLAVAVLLLGVVLPVAAQVPAPRTLAPGPVDITGVPFALDPADPARTTFGTLRFAGGLVLTARYPQFGGVSGISVDASGDRLLAVTDAGTWLAADLASDAEGRLTGIGNGRAGIIEDARGRPLAGGRRWDAEALSPLRRGQTSGRYLIGFERDDRVEEYAFNGRRMLRIARLATGDYFAGVQNNEGPEGVAVLPGGGSLIFAEVKRDAEGRDVGLIRAPDGTLSRFTLKRPHRGSIVGAEALPGGRIALLYRYFERFPPVLETAIAILPRPPEPDETVEPALVFASTPGLAIDNWEGIAAHTDAAGRTVLTIISDDNFNGFQRTLLMRFVMPDDGADAPGETARP